MKVKNVITRIVFGFFMSMVLPTSALPQQGAPPLNVNDSLTLPEILKHVLLSYPTIAKAQEAIGEAEAAVGLAKSGYYPNIGANAGYTRIGPVPELTIPNLGHFVMAPYNNYDAAINVHENIYDFEKTTRKVQLEK